VEDQVDTLLKGLLGGSGTASGSQNNIDPQMLLGILELLGQLDEVGDAERLLLALKPFMGPERSGRVEDAVQVTKLCKAAKSALQLFSKGNSHEAAL